MQDERKTAEEAASVATRVAGAIGKGLVAGLIGTAVMTIAQMVEMEMSGRDASNTPYKAAKKVFGVKAKDKESKKTISNLMHFVYGSSWGIPRALMAEFGTKGTTGTFIHFAAVWGTELVLLPSLHVAKPVTEWKPKAISEDILFHSIYAVATGLAADALVGGTDDEEGKIQTASERWEIPE
ncbi:hypothetical protein [Pontibacter akesuensis]|uniref:DUF1440 domain-containing protein n=1 Tax=Pontibacter akesuensis TaxID=388950 RepID=A0A1I7GS95_9BACT|nr:hypothetical protein [Pontibacter akesuensis]GHA55339.1 hypothetical protein GCM10007389_03490 [Pontibacter akesuensis]SFU51300.1 hypothetical protein SAMN04487941_1226 [Pontibacter akesuensis]